MCGAFEIGGAPISRSGASGRGSMTLAIRRALESTGVVFIDENGDGPGVRLRKRSKEKSRK